MERVTHLTIATRNAGKVDELRALLSDLPLVLRLADGMPELEETGSTFSENAELKARAAAEWSCGWALADDSGLEVDALNGSPGVHSNRFAGDNTNEADRNAALLRLLADTPVERRTARYRAAIAIAAPDGRVWISEGCFEGRIVDEARGRNGFGYDPHFFVPEYGCTVGEMDPALKNRISHRARAMARAREILERICR